MIVTLNTNACAVSVLRKRGPGVTYITNDTLEQIKAGLRLRAHARHAFSRIWDRQDMGPPHRTWLSVRTVNSNVKLIYLDMFPSQ